MIKLAHIPATLVSIRFAIAFFLLYDSLDHQTGTGFVISYVIAVVSDIFDGIIARQLGVSTPRLRQADSWADIFLYLSIAISTWLVFPQVILDFKIPLLIAIVAQITLFTISLIKFRKMPSFHTYTAKVWGLILLAATVALFGFNYDKLLWFAIVFCLINSIEEIMMTLLLSEWQCDVLSIFHAMSINQTLQSEYTNSESID